MSQEYSHIGHLPEVRAAVEAMSTDGRMTPAHVEALCERLGVILRADARVRDLDYRFVADLSQRIRPVLGALGTILGSSAAGAFLHLIGVVNIEPSGIIMVAILAAIVVHSMLPDRHEQRHELQEAGGRLYDLVYDLQSMEVDSARLMEAMKKAVPAIVQAAESHPPKEPPARQRPVLKLAETVASV